MSTTETLSEAAVSLFRLHIERKGHIAVDNSTREPYRETREGRVDDRR